MLGAGRTAAGDVRLVEDAHAAHGGEAAQAVRDERGGCSQRLLGKGLGGFLGEWPLRQAHRDGLAGLGGLNRSHERNLVRRAAAGLAALDLAAEVGVVDLDTAGELARLLAQEHDLHDLAFEQPSRGVGHVQMALELQGRDVVLGLCHQVHSQEPLGQRQLAGLEDRAADQAALVAAAAALEIQPPVAAELAVPRRYAAPAGRAL